MRLRIFICLSIGLATGVFCWFLLAHFHLGAGDFQWAVFAAQDLLAHQNPYDRPMQLYPLTCAIFGLPFVWLRPEVAAGAFYGVSSALMAFGLSRFGYHRLLVFFAYPYWAAMIAAQWSPLLVAGALLPLALPVTVVKPQLGWPILLTHSTKRGLVACGLLLAASMLVMPRWPWLWVSHFQKYEHFVPLLVLPGPLLALALFHWRERDARFLFLMAITPQRWFYDMLVLWLIPKSRREIVGTVGLSWVVGIWRWYHNPHTYPQIGRWMILFMYLPMLAIIFARPQNLTRESEEERWQPG